MAERKVVEAAEPFSLTLPSGPLMVAKGDRYWSDDAVVVGREHLFAELTVKTSRPVRPTTADSETTTAAPGARRTTSRPPGGNQPGKAPA